MTLRICFFSLLLCCGAFSTALAGDGLLTRLQQRYEAMASFQADFAQIQVNAASKETVHGNGTLTYAKPRLVRWETTDPEPELLVVDATTVWDYFPYENVAYRYPAEQVLGAKSMLRFVSGETRLDKDFIVDAKGEDAGLALYDLFPKESESGMVQASVWIDPATALIRRVRILDFWGNSNELTFAAMRLDVPVKPDMFTFDPPKGVTVMRDTPAR
ncbi:MAG: outer membrane lipoprotein chaperone LolA [Desulfovibrionaceae bacterium]